MLIDNLKEHMRYLKKKDEIAIKKVERRLATSTRFNLKFWQKVNDAYAEFKLHISNIIVILKECVDNPMGEFFFGIQFNEQQVLNVLQNMQFVAMLMCNSMLKRTLNLSKETDGQLKLRIYIAILNFARYMDAKFPHKNINQKAKKNIRRGEKK